MVHKLLAILCLICFSVALIGCATTNPNGTPTTGASTAGGAVAGAVLGGAIGALAGLIPGGGIAASVARGAIAGAATGVITGAIAGFAYGKYQEQKSRDQQAAEAFHQYKSEQGQKVYVEAVEVKPGTSVRGENVALNSTFSVLTGTAEPVPVEVMQTVMVENKVCGQPFSNRTDRASGTYVITLPMQIPANAPEGKYQLVTIVRTANAIDQKSCDFLVAKKAEPAPTEPAGTEEPLPPPGEEKPAA
jgi:hypothetical protein